MKDPIFLEDDDCVLSNLCKLTDSGKRKAAQAIREGRPVAVLIDISRHHDEIKSQLRADEDAATRKVVETEQLAI